MRGRLPRSLVLALGLVGLAATGHARDLTVGVEAIDYSPVYGVRDGVFQGAGRQILDAYAAAMGHRLTYQPLPVKRLYAELLHGGIDFKFPDSPDWQPGLRQGLSVAYSKPVIAYIDGTIIRKDRPSPGVDQIRTLGTVAGFTPFAWSDVLAGGKVELKENPGLEQLLRQVKTGRVDGAYVNVAVALHQVEASGDLAGAIVYAPDLPHVADTYRLSSVKAPELIAEFDDWLGRNQKMVAEIIARTGSERGVR